MRTPFIPPVILAIPFRFTSTYDLAQKTVLLLRDIISKSKWTSPRYVYCIVGVVYCSHGNRELMERVREDGKRIIAAQAGGKRN